MEATLKAAPTGAAFDIVLMLHVACFLIALASVFVTGTQAWRARAGPGAPSTASVTRYFKPGINWPGRTIYVVVVLGFVLVSMSKGAYNFTDSFVQLGLLLWVVAVSLAEFIVWPGERQLQAAILTEWASESPVATTSKRIATRVALSAWTVSAVIIVATVVMVSKP